ncbi:Ca-activated chloride channel family protein [Rhizobium sp. NFR07]|uniref:vWA domain-containing protein n=1 Tax=Rhizobium sp. NFR07 TaxID=1566262 RepID=UPI0008E17612|nr:VWA domain-containing protein [Rhizobium sp. NFR07]SFB32529.1 Ca-activated chloride channel family protein [Rhizobium sp. NFR07]
MYQLEFPWLLLALPLPFLVWFLMPPKRETSASVRMPFFDQIAKAAGIEPSEGSVIAHRSWPQSIVLALSWCLIVIALARPQYVEPPLEKKEPQRDILLALDLSQSMETRDFRATDGTLVSRIDAVRQVVTGFITKRREDRIGLIAFGDAPYPLAPFTMDHALVHSMVESLLPGIAGQRTSMGDSLGLAIRMFDKTTAPDKVLILLTDGNDTASRMPPLKAADVARTKKIAIHAIGMGDPAATGEDKLDTATLEKIASGTGGRYFFGADQEQLQSIYETLDRITPVEQKLLTWRPRVELFHWPLAGALMLLALYYLIAGSAGLIRRRISA